MLYNDGILVFQTLFEIHLFFGGKMKRISNFLTGVIIGGIAGVVITILAAPGKGNEWLDEIQKKSQDILVEFNRAAQEYREEMEKDLEKRRNPSN